MAYADQQMSTRKVVSIALVVLLHALIGYAFITGLAYNVIKKASKDLNVFDVADEPPPPEEAPPPPPPEQNLPPPPVVAPPPIVQAPVVSAPVIQTVQAAPPPVITPIAPTAPPPPPPPPSAASPAKARGNPGSWVTSDDYPSRALREEREGVTTISFTIGADGKVTNCNVTASSGSPDLDQATCTNFVRRARYTPAKDAAGNAMSTNSSQRIRWQIPKG